MAGGIGSVGEYGQVYLVLNDTWSLDFDTLLWTELAPMPTGLFSHTCNMVTMANGNQQMLIFGGVLAVTTVQPIPLSTTTFLFNPSDNGWGELVLDPNSPPPPPRMAHISADMPNGIIIHGGIGSMMTNLADTWMLNVVNRTWLLLNELGPQLSGHMAFSYLGDPTSPIVLMTGGCAYPLTAPTYSHFWACGVQNATFRLDFGSGTWQSLDLAIHPQVA